MENELDELVSESISYIQNNLLMKFSFLAGAFQQLNTLSSEKYNIASDGSNIYCNSRYILKLFLDNAEYLTRQYLHTVLHCIFQHQFTDSHMDFNIWNLACDIAVENIISELDTDKINHYCESKQAKEISKIKNSVDFMTAEKIYGYYMEHQLIEKRYEYLSDIFKADEHKLWYNKEQLDIPRIFDDSEGNDESKNDCNKFKLMNDEYEDESNNEMSKSDKQEIWKNISRQIQLEFEMQKSERYTLESSSIMKNLYEINKEKTDYSEFLRKFAVFGEEVKIDEDSFDYNFYIYGLSLYKNIPLIEPLEYKEVKRIREFVITIDTSGSVRGEIVQAFIQKTYNILKQQESFFTKVNIHIIQCDYEVLSDVKITSQQEFDNYINSMELKGFRGTDFRPAFEYVNELCRNKEFIDLRGLIYFTDGYGDFPEKPNYKTAFVFLEDNFNNPDIPVWAIKVVLSSEQIKEF
ncbi:MAG: metallopeptidase [Ruminococcus sp.]|nr:metallopeptidase [Ruminococcus sp.]